MARQDVQLNLPGIEVTPAAQPVDTYYRTNLPKPADMVTNTALQLGQALAALSPTIRDFAAWQEEGARRHDEEAAQLTAQDLSDEQLKNINKWTEEEWKQFGDQGGRTTFQIATLVYANRRIAKEMLPDIVAEYEAMKGEMLDPTKTPDIAQMVSELGGRWRGKFEGHYARQGAESILGPLLEKIEGEAHESRKNALSDHEDANFSQAAYDAFVSIGSGVPEADEFLSIEVLKREAGSMSGKSPAVLRGLTQDALVRAAKELVKEDPVHGEDLAMELLDRADEELGLDGKPLFRPGTKDADKLKDAERDVRRLVREQDFDDQGDEEDIVYGLASEWIIELTDNNQEPSDEDIIAWRVEVLRPQLEAEGLSEQQIARHLLNAQEFIKEQLDKDKRRDDKADPEHLNDLYILAWSGDLTKEAVSTELRRGAINLDDAKGLRAALTPEGLGYGLQSRNILETAGELEVALFGTTIDQLAEDDRKDANKLLQGLRTQLSRRMQEAQGDPQRELDVLTDFTEGGRALQFAQKKAESSGFTTRRVDLQIGPIFSSREVTTQRSGLARAFIDGLPLAVKEDSPRNLELQNKFTDLLRSRARTVRRELMNDGVRDPREIIEAVAADFEENGAAYIEEMQSAVDTAAAEATGVLEQRFTAAKAVEGKPAFLDVDVETGLIPFAGVHAGMFDLGDLWDDNESVLEDPLRKPRQKLEGDSESFAENTVGLLTAFVEGNVSTTRQAWEAAGMRREFTGESYYAGDGKYLPQTRWVGDGPSPLITDVSPESITIDGTTVDRAGAKKLLNSLLGLQGISSEDLLTAEKPINIGETENTGVIPIWFKPGEHAAFDLEIQALVEDGQTPSEEALEATKWGQIVKNLDLPQIYRDEESGKPMLMAVILSKQQHSLHHTTKGNQ